MENDDRRESPWSFVEMHSQSSRRTRPGCKHATRFDFDFDSECQEHAAKTAGVSIGGVLIGDWANRKSKSKAVGVWQS